MGATTSIICNEPHQPQLSTKQPFSLHRSIPLSVLGSPTVLLLPLTTAHPASETESSESSRGKRVDKRSIHSRLILCASLSVSEKSTTSTSTPPALQHYTTHSLPGPSLKSQEPPIRSGERTRTKKNRATEPPRCVRNSRPEPLLPSPLLVLLFAHLLTLGRPCS